MEADRDWNTDGSHPSAGSEREWSGAGRETEKGRRS